MHLHIHTHVSPLCHTPTATSVHSFSTRPSGKMEGAISLHFLHFSFEVRRGSSSAGKSFHYTARRLDNNNKLDGSGADEKPSDRTNEKKGDEKQIPASGCRRAAASNQNAAFQMISRVREGRWIFWLYAAGVFSYDCLCLYCYTDSDGETRQDTARKLPFYCAFNTQGNSKCFGWLKSTFLKHSKTTEHRVLIEKRESESMTCISRGEI